MTDNEYKSYYIMLLVSLMAQPNCQPSAYHHDSILAARKREYTKPVHRLISGLGLVAMLKSLSWTLSSCVAPEMGAVQPFALRL